MCFKPGPLAQADDRFEAMESNSKPCRQEEMKLNGQSESGSELLLGPSWGQPEDSPTKTNDKAVFSSNALVIAGVNFLVGNSLNVLQQWASIPNSILRYLILSVAIAFTTSLVSLRLHWRKAAAVFRYISLAFTTSTSAVLWYYLFISPLWSRFTNRDR